METPSRESGRGCPTPDTSESPRDFARRCEDLVAAYLAGIGWKILTRNWHCRRGELDLVARDGRTTVFVEVKGKRGDLLGRPAEMVGRRKVGRLVSAALAWIASAPRATGACRFDVVCVTATVGGELRIDHYRDAFTLDEV